MESRRGQPQYMLVAARCTCALRRGEGMFDGDELNLNLRDRMVCRLLPECGL